MLGRYIQTSPAFAVRIRLAWANNTPSAISRVVRPAAARPAPELRALTMTTDHGDGLCGRMKAAAEIAATGGRTKAAMANPGVTGGLPPSNHRGPAP